MKKNLLRLLLCISVLGNAQEVGNIDVGNEYGNLLKLS